MKNSFFKPYRGEVKGCVQYRGIWWELGEHPLEAQKILGYQFYAKGLGWGVEPVVPLSDFPQEIQQELLATR